MEESAIEVPMKSANPVTVLKDITKLVNGIKLNSKEKINEVAELKQLRSEICNQNAVRSVTACQGLLALVEDAILTPMHAISMLVSAFHNIQNFAGVTATLGVLLRWDITFRPAPYQCPFSILAPQHPLITLLKEKKETWADIFRLIQNFFFYNDDNIRERSMCLLRPVLIYVLCDPQASPILPRECRQEAWAFLLRSLHNPHAKQLVFEMLPWFQISDESRCVEAGTLVLELCQSALAASDDQLCLALAPLAAATTVSLVSRGADPEPCLTTMVRMVYVAPNAASCVMLLLADTIAVCPATFLHAVVRSCRDILEMHACSMVAAYAVVAALLPWLSNSSFLTRDALQLASELLSTIRITAPGHWQKNTGRLVASPWFRLLRHSYPNVHEAAELLRIQESWRNSTEVTEWLKLVKLSSATLPARFSPFFCSLLISDVTNKIEEKDESEWLSLSVLVWLCSEQPEVCERVALTMFYQLAQEHRPYQQLALLRSLALMGKQENNMVFVLVVLKSLARGGHSSSTLAIDLYLRLWKVQPRAYRLLYECLIAPSNSDNPEQLWELNVAKASAIREICIRNPDAHGSELVPVLSQLLTKCTGVDGSLASSLVIQGITSLCRAGVMDVASTWRGLGPKLAHDKRPTVVVSLCGLLGMASYLPTTTNKFEEFLSETIITLWEWAQHKNGLIACAALKALADFHLNQITLKGFPEKFRLNLKLPPSFCKTPIDAKRNPVEVLPYVPGECWKQLLQGFGVQEDRQSAVCKMIASWMCYEIKSFHRGLYSQIAGKPEPTSYSHLPDSSILRILFDLARAENALAELALCILAEDFPRPLPPVSWSFLEEKLNTSDDSAVRRCCLVIAARHCKVSSSASRVLITQMSTIDHRKSNEDCKSLFSVLLYLGQGIPPNHLGPFVQKSLQIAADSSQNEVGGDCSLLQFYLTNMKTAIRSPDVPEANSSVLCDLMEKLVDVLGISHPAFSFYVDCAVALPQKNIERIISPSLWWEFSLEKLVSAIRISSAIAIAQDSNMPLAALNECIEVCSKRGHSELELMLEAVLLVVRSCRNHASNCRWVLQLLGRIQALKADKEISSETKQQVLQSSCDILLVSVIALAGHDVLAGDPKVLVTSSLDRMLLFPRAIQALLSSDPWDKISQQMLEWLHNMSITSEISSLLAKTFRLGITALRENEHFKKPSVWMRILSS